TPRDFATLLCTTSSSIIPLITNGQFVQLYFRIVMDEQEKRKLDRKRARNRAAATKCRQKKIDRIQDLERMVANEKQRSQSLDMEMESLRGTLHQLQQLIQMHEQRGCVRS
uniref:BZIP domain-containing protein n=1 Tax=Angiostrongylus cantonensis TaxID=6313 RepID=A0A0K0DAM4_ANGCA